MKYLLLILSFNFLLLSAHGQLKRKGQFGARFTITQMGDTTGCQIEEVKLGTSAALQLKTKDVIIKIGNLSFRNEDEFLALFSQYREGDLISMTLIRNKKIIQVRGKVVGRPREKDGNDRVVYDEAPFRGGRLRVIINKPVQEGKLPAMLFIPGYVCSSIDGLSDNHPYKRVINAFAEAGFVTLRIEKSGLGDSENTPPCRACDLHDEIENFEVGLRKLKSLPYVDTNQIILFGHSMGGIIAPAIAAKQSVKGVIVYGTIAKSWFEYQIEMYRIQNALAGMSPKDIDAFLRNQYEILYRFFIQKESLESIALNQKLREQLVNEWGYDGNNQIFDRNALFWRQIQDLPLWDYWQKSRAKVLVMFGESDFQAFSKTDHNQIVEWVNQQYPGNAQLKIFPETDHYFAKVGTMQNAYNLFSSQKFQEIFNAYNPEIGQFATRWSTAVVNDER